ncbi:MAG: 4-hydroxythreonine-4-phosphate dehydrogenase PdxA [Chloroflexi bacterium]|nr:4-hydroxythreonine-4-phosphate dehydrogenase PdxA [Chloroflexota bacterium]
MGDAAGIGPEVIVKALASPDIHHLCIPLVVGDVRVLEQTIRMLSSKAKLNEVEKVAQAKGQADRIDVLDIHNLDPNTVKYGEISPAAGKAAMEYVTKAAHLAQEGEVEAIVTAPLNKEASRLAGFPDMGHLELLSRLSGAKECATMLVSGQLRVVHLSTHLSLSAACEYVKRANILSRLKLTHESFKTWGFEKLVIAVAALNPHAGEGGLLGLEEKEEIAPAIGDARMLGIDARGPFPADTVFLRATSGEFTAVLATYHDQGHIPIKVHGFEQSVSVTLGLPFVRTSVDHGTAFDIAGKGIANPQSLIQAIKVAVELCTSKKAHLKKPITFAR